MRYADDDLRTHATYGKFFITPQDKNDRDFLLAVDRRTRSDIDLKYGFIADYDWEMNTVANAFFETMIGIIKYLFQDESTGHSDGIGFKFYDLFTATISNKINESAEKEGNLNIFFETAERVDDLIANGIPPQFNGERKSMFEVFKTGNPDEDNLLLRIDNQAKYDIARSHGIQIGEKNHMATCGIAYTFFENLFIELLVRTAMVQKENEGEEAMVSVNFNDNIEFHCIIKDGGARIMMRPGMNVKMLIKNDGFTEKTMGDLDD